MDRKFAAIGVLSALLAAAPPRSVSAQPRPAAPQPVQPPKFETFTPIDERNAQEIRQELSQLLRDYPPSLGQVLRLDPSLLTREGYLDSYPRLAGFLAQHPDITRHPTFYLGSPDFTNPPEDARSRAIRGMVDMTESVTLLVGFLGFFTLVGWIIHLIADHRRWLRASKTQTDVHAKLFDRLTSNEDLLAYLQTPAGQQFLQSAPISVDAGPRTISAPIARILWSVQAGVVLAVVGIGLWLAKNNVMDELVDPLSVIAAIVIALGAGFALSAAIAYLLSLRLGLLETPKP
jgi:hypothetical protein